MRQQQNTQADATTSKAATTANAALAGTCDAQKRATEDRWNDSWNDEASWRQAKPLQETTIVLERPTLGTDGVKKEQFLVSSAGHQDTQVGGPNCREMEWQAEHE